MMVSYQVAIQKATKGAKYPTIVSAILPSSFPKKSKKIICFLNGWLVVDLPTPLKNDGVSSSVGMMTFPI